MAEGPGSRGGGPGRISSPDRDLVICVHLSPLNPRLQLRAHTRPRACGRRWRACSCGGVHIASCRLCHERKSSSSPRAAVNHYSKAINTGRQWLCDSRAPWPQAGGHGAVVRLSVHRSALTDTRIGPYTRICMFLAAATKLLWAGVPGDTELVEQPLSGPGPERSKSPRYLWLYLN